MLQDNQMWHQCMASYTAAEVASLLELFETHECIDKEQEKS